MERPLYRSLATRLERRIAEGRYPIGSQLPPEPALEQEFGVSRITIRQALSMLKRRGLVASRSGIGTVVRAVVTLQFQRQHHVFFRGQRRQQVEGLEDESDQTPADRRARLLVDGLQGLPIKADASRAGNIQAGQESEQGGLAGPRSADDGEAFAFGHTQVHAREDV